MAEKTYQLFGIRSGAGASGPDLGSAAPGDEHSFWTPRAWQFGRRGLPRLPFLAMALLHKAGVFATEEFAVSLFCREGRVVHYCGVQPRWFRFPFMARHDLQIGPVWTDPSCRRAGLAIRSLRLVLSAYHKPDRNFWYVTRAENEASVALAARSGLKLCGELRRRKRAAIGLLGSFVPADTISEP